MPRPLVMGVVNVTPDSFSDGGRFLDAEAALAHARRLIAEVRRESAVRISVDTMKPAVARAAVAAGAGMWNDITALGWSPDSPAVAAELGCEVCLMHMQGDPRTMQQDPHYEDVVGEVAAFLAGRAGAAMAAGVRREKVWLDPGVGFGKRPEHNLALLKHLHLLTETGFPVLLGVSRKRFIRTIDGTAVDAADRLGGSLAGALWGAAQGVKAVRVHDVRETVQALKVWAAIEEAS